MIPLPFQIVTVHNEKKKVVTKCFRNIVRSSDLDLETILGIKKKKSTTTGYVMLVIWKGPCLHI